MHPNFIGDIKDYPKYSLIRALAGVKLPKKNQLRIGLHWYHNDQVPPAGHGQNRKFLQNANIFRKLDADLFDLLMAFEEPMNRTFEYFEAHGILPLKTQFYGAQISFPNKNASKQNRLVRLAWTQKAHRVLGNAQLILIDPDNGLERPSYDRFERAALKHAYFEELRVFWERDQSLVVFQDSIYRKPSEESVRRVEQFRRHGYKGRMYPLLFDNGTARVIYFVAPATKHRTKIVARIKEFLEGPASEFFRPC